jgi:hypothetical protein
MKDGLSLLGFAARFIFLAQASSPGAVWPDFEALAFLILRGLVQLRAVARSWETLTNEQSLLDLKVHRQQLKQHLRCLCD